MSAPSRRAKSAAGFVDALGKIYGFYTVSFLGFVLVLALLEQLGVPNRIIGYLFVFLTLTVYAVIGIITRTRQISEYYVAGRSVPGFYNGLATAADWMSAASFVGMAGSLFLLGYDGLAYVLGWTGGFVLVAIFVAAYLRKFGAYTIPDFFAERYGGNLARLLGVIVLISCSFTYLVAQVYGTGLIASRFLGMDFNLAVYAGLVGILLCSMLGGMRAVTWTQVAQCIVLLVAYLTPVIILSWKDYGVPIPQLTYGLAIQDITAREHEMIAKGLADAKTLKPHIQPFTSLDPLNFFGLIFCLMVGTASLPHILMRYFTTLTVREARSSVAWSMLFIFLLYFTAPAYAAFAKLEVYSNVIGKPVTELPAWIYTYGKLELVKICGVNAIDVQTVLAACGKIAGQAGVLRLQDFNIDTNAIVISMPEIAGMPYVIAGLVAAGGLAAALSTADGLLLAIANALSHDIYYKMLDPNAPTGRRLVVARLLLIVVALLAAYVAATKPTDIVELVAWAFSLAAAGLFPGLVLGIWWKRANSWGVIAGIIAGFGICLYYVLSTRYLAVNFYETWSFLSTASDAAVQEFHRLKQAYAQAITLGAGPAAQAAAWAALDAHAQTIANWWGVLNISAALFGLPAGFLAIIIVSLLTPAPSAEVRQFVEDIRQPGGEPVFKEKSR